MQPLAATKPRVYATRAPRPAPRPKFIDGVLFNRGNRRRLHKAQRCIERATKVPAKVRTALNATVLTRVADLYGMAIDGTGRVAPKKASAVAGVVTAETPEIAVAA